MKRVDAWYLPDRDTHFKPWLLRHQQRRDGRLCYQLHKYEPAVETVTRRRVAVDVGAHIGFLSYWMAHDFMEVHAFEPHPMYWECWRANMPKRAGLTLHPEALGASAGTVSLIDGIENSGATRIDTQPGSCAVVPLDVFDFPVLDFLKVDCEGYEAFVIEGAVETIRRCRPTILVEQKRKCGIRYGRKDDEALTLLESLGAQRVWVSGGDHLLSFPVEGSA